MDVDVHVHIYLQIKKVIFMPKSVNTAFSTLLNIPTKNHSYIKETNDKKRELYLD